MAPTLRNAAPRKEKSMFQPHRPSEGGYTLVEALVVVALIGLISLVTVPNFVGYMRANRLRAELRQLNVDIRSARQNAVTKNRVTKISFTPESGVYTIDETTAKSDFSTAAWTNLETRAMHEQVEINSSTGFTDVDSDEDTIEIVFRNNGTALEAGTLVLRTLDDITLNQYTVTMDTSGRLTTVHGSY